MGTNYYAVRNRPTVEEPIHIGKSSAGYRFLFEGQNVFRNMSVDYWHSYKQIKEWLYKNVVETKEYVILDEYDEEISYEQFIEIVESKQVESKRTMPPYKADSKGYEFYNRWFR